MTDLPFTFTLPMPQIIPSRVDNHIERRLSALRGQFLDQEAYQTMLSSEDQLLYEVYEILKSNGIDICFKVDPGKFMGKIFD